MAFDDLNAVAPQTFDHEPIARIGGAVRAEIAYSQRSWG